MLKQLLTITAVFAAFHAHAQFTAWDTFPEPAPGAFGVVGTGLPDGTLLVWDGDALYRQVLPGADAFEALASGYAGDPAFIELSPDGQRVLMGAGLRNFANPDDDFLYEVDLANPVDYSAGAELLAINHFDGVYLTDTLVAIDAGKADFSGADVSVIDLSGLKSGKSARPTVRRVLTGPETGRKDLVLEKPSGSYASSLDVSADGATLYVMDGNTRELRAFAVADVIAAFENATLLDWATDGALVGTYNSGGVAGILPNGLLVIPGSDGLGGTGGVQLVNPATGTVVQTIAPVETSFYSVIVNETTGDVYPIDSGFGSPTAGTVFALEGVTQPLPASGLAGLGLLAAATVAAGARLLRRKEG